VKSSGRLSKGEPIKNKPAGGIVGEKIHEARFIRPLEKKYRKPEGGKRAFYLQHEKKRNKKKGWRGGGRLGENFYSDKGTRRRSKTKKKNMKGRKNPGGRGG